jgi:hypothetical protein
MSDLLTDLWNGNQIRRDFGPRGPGAHLFICSPYQPSSFQTHAGINTPISAYLPGTSLLTEMISVGSPYILRRPLGGWVFGTPDRDSRGESSQLFLEVIRRW